MSDATPNQSPASANPDAAKIGNALQQIADQHADLSGKVATLATVVSRLENPQTQAAFASVMEALNKPGWNTAEFWINLIGLIGILLLAAEGIVPGQAAVWITVTGLICYGFSRMALKARIANATLAASKEAAK